MYRFEREDEEMSCRSDLREAIDQYGPAKGKSSERLKEICCLALLPAVASLLLVMSTLAASAAVDDAKAKKWIMAGLTNKMGYAGDPNIDALINKNYKVDEVRAGWQNLKRCRDAGNSLNLDLAAAEHYSYMRLTASMTGDTEIQNCRNGTSPSSLGQLQSTLRNISRPALRQCHRSIPLSRRGVRKGWRPD
jgi:hypothetical protein